MAFVLLFVLALGLHIVFGAKAHNEQLAFSRKSPISRIQERDNRRREQASDNAPADKGDLNHEYRNPLP
ncbi:hypothetical protein [Candidatus Binatus sp.]|uniref:hypothetical protein n=1 Tax=Candidatus Binatus sp. TaxID=2811406 RepID=UPI003CC576E1